MWVHIDWMIAVNGRDSDRSVSRWLCVGPRHVASDVACTAAKDEAGVIPRVMSVAVKNAGKI